VRAISEMDPANKLRSDTWVMINTTAKPASAGPLASDGLIAVVGHNHQGKIQHRIVVGGTSLTYRGADESANARKVKTTPLQMPKDLQQ